jgi:hypothetical protein
MKFIFATILLTSALTAFSNECDVVSQLERAEKIEITNIDGDYKSIDFQNVSISSTKVEVVTGGHQDDVAGKAAMRGTYTFKERKIKNETYCVLKKKDDFMGVSYVALKKESETRVRFYVGLSQTLTGLDQVVKEYNEAQMFFYLNI